MSTLEDIAFFLYNCDKSTLLILSGSDDSKKSMLLDAMTSCLESDIETHDDDGYDPSPSFEGGCRVLMTMHRSPVVDSTYPWVRNIGFIRVDDNTIASYSTTRRLTVALRYEVDKITDDD